LALVAACLRLGTDNPVKWGWLDWGLLIIGNEIMAIWLCETQIFTW